MNRSPMLRGSHLFAIVIGVTDGILNALTLAAAHFITGERPTFALSVRIALGSALCGIFVFFTAEYARLRGELLDAERQLNLEARGKFAMTGLGRQVRREAVVSALFSSVSNFIGAFFPLWLGATLPGRALFAIIPSIVALGLLGVMLAHVMHGKKVLWSMILMLSGIAFSALGVWLHIA